jgi:HPt (histidine-containing phosphotransfer) domain-containing protein
MNLKALAKNSEMEEDEFREIVELFITSTQSDLTRLQSALAKGSVREVAIAAHSIKGSAGMIGMMEIYEVAKRVEMRAHEGSVEGTEKAIEEIGEELNLVVKTLHESPSIV